MRPPMSIAAATTDSADPAASGPRPSAAPDDGRTLAARLQLYAAILRTAIAERLAYRADFAVKTAFQFLPLITQIFLWGAIFGAGTDAARGEIEGYRYGEIISYYLLTMVSRGFSSMPGLAGGIARDVRDGQIKRFLVQPLDLLGFLFWHRVAHKLVYFTIAGFVLATAFYLLRGYFPGWPEPAVMAAFVASLLMGFLLGFLLESLLGLVAFWFLEVSSLLFIYMMLNYFLSGHMIPLDFFPEPFSTWMQALPFKYLAYVPPAIFLGRYEPHELPGLLLGEAVWIVGLLIANRWLLARGVRRYGAFGG